MEAKIMNVEKSGDEFIVNRIDETGLKERIPCREIRGAVVLPDALNRLPGYFLLLGIKGENGKSLIFLTESEEADPKALINTLIGLEAKYRFHAIYIGGFSNLTPGVLPDRFFIDLHENFKENIPWVRLCPDPYADNISMGINFIAQLELEKGFDPSLEDSVLRRHLNNQQIGELPGCEFYGVHGLRHILGGLSIHKRLDIQAIESHREAALMKKTFKSLSGITKAAWDEVERTKEKLREQDEYRNDFFIMG
jgi:hypothetical protein